MVNPLLSLAAAAARWLPSPLKRALYRLGPVSSGLRSALNKAAASGLSEIEVAGGLIVGTRLILDLQSEKDYWLGSYEMDLQEAIRDLVKPGTIAFDVGANIGYVSLMLAKLVGERGMVFAFEPLPANQERMKKNLELNPEMNIELIPKAVGDQSGEVEFLVHESGGMGKISGANGRETQYQDEMTVECISLDDFVYMQGNPKPDLVKIDIEGGEGSALRGMSKIIAEVKPMLIIELHGKEATQACWEILNNADYGIRRLKRGYPIVSNVSELDWKSYILARAKA